MKKGHAIVSRTVFLAALLCAATASAQSWAWDDGTTPYVQSPAEVVDRMLRLAAPKPGELLVDLGSGDGRIVIEAAKKYGARGLGVDIDPRLVRLAQDNARAAGVEALARFESRDFFEMDFGAADIVSAYLLPEVNLKLRPKLLAMKPGTRIVTHDYDMGDWPFDEMVELPVAEKLIGPLGRSRAYLFVVPADARGTWRSTLPEHGGAWQFRVAQTFQVLDVTAHAGASEQRVRGMRLRGTEIRLVMSGLVAGKPSTHAFRGEVQGDRIRGQVTITNGEESRTLPWTAQRAAK
jgi:SAM-dependent methyltransferase